MPGNRTSNLVHSVSTPSKLSEGCGHVLIQRHNRRVSAGTVSTKLLCSTSRIVPRSERTFASRLLNTRPRNATAAMDGKYNDTTRALVRYRVAPSMHAQIQHTVCRSCQHTAWWRDVTNTP